MKMYFVNNSYCKGVQAGIQALHSAIRLLTKYEDDSVNGTKCVDMITDWVNNHETVALLNGGNHADLMDFYSIMESTDTFPFALFREEGLNDAASSIAVLCSTEQVQDMSDYRNGIITEKDLEYRYGYVESIILSKLALMRTI